MNVTEGVGVRAQRQLVAVVPIVAGLIIVGAALTIGQPAFSGLFILGFALLVLVVLSSSLWIILIAYAVFALRADRRMRALSAAHPDAVLLHVVVTASLAPQLNALAAALGTASRVRVRTYVTVVVDAASVTFHGGAGAPTELLRIPRASLVSAQLVMTTAARRDLPSLLLLFAEMPGEPLVLVPVSWPGVAPKPVEHGVLEQKIGAIDAHVAR